MKWSQTLFHVRPLIVSARYKITQLSKLNYALSPTSLHAKFRTQCYRHTPDTHNVSMKQLDLKAPYNLYNST